MESINSPTFEIPGSRKAAWVGVNSHSLDLAHRMVILNNCKEVFKWYLHPMLTGKMRAFSCQLYQRRRKGRKSTNNPSLSENLHFYAIINTKTPQCGYWDIKFSSTRGIWSPKIYYYMEKSSLSKRTGSKKRVYAWHLTTVGGIPSTTIAARRFWWCCCPHWGACACRGFCLCGHFSSTWSGEPHWKQAPLIWWHFSSHDSSHNSGN